MIDIANGCRETAKMLEHTAEEAAFDIGVPGYLHDALLRLYYAVGLDHKMMACSAQLGEDTPQETVDAVLGASTAVDTAADKVFAQIEDYVRGDDNLEAEIDALKLGDPADDIDDLLKKLYKCEGIIRMAYHVSPRYPIYGIRLMDEQRLMQGGALRDDDDYVPKPPEEEIEERLGVDIEALYEIRETLAARIGEMLQEGGDA